MKIASVLAVLPVLAILPARSIGSPIVIYDNFGTNQSFNQLQAWSVNGPSTIGPEAVALSFTPSTALTFDAVLLPLASFAGTNSVIVSLAPDVNGHPGAAPLETFPLAGLPNPSAPTVFQLNSVLDPVLTGGNTYWITVFPGASDTQVGWFENSTGALGFQRSVDGGNTWDSFLGSPSPAMEVLGNQVVTPEPSSLTLLAGLGASTIGWSWRRRKSAAR
jgi:hypothetical protein